MRDFYLIGIVKKQIKGRVSQAIKMAATWAVNLHDLKTVSFFSLSPSGPHFKYINFINFSPTGIEISCAGVQELHFWSLKLRPVEIVHISLILGSELSFPFFIVLFYTDHCYK